MNNRPKSLALFDFDGTITTKDTFIEFIKFTEGTSGFYWGILKQSPLLLLYALKVIPNHLAKQQLFSSFYKDIKSTIFNSWAKDFKKYIDVIIKPKALQRLEFHRNQGDRIVIVSAGLENMIEPWCRENNIELIATKIEFNNGKLTGKFASKNCYAEQKVVRIKELLNVHEYDVIYAYGNSKGDLAMLELATERHYDKNIFA
jgi:phosphatidylglycerophosphatase C